MAELLKIILYKTNKGKWSYDRADSIGESITVAAYSVKQALYCAYQGITYGKGSYVGVVKESQPTKPTILTSKDFVGGFELGGLIHDDE